MRGRGSHGGDALPVCRGCRRRNQISEIDISARRASGDRLRLPLPAPAKQTYRTWRMAILLAHLNNLARFSQPRLAAHQWRAVRPLSFAAAKCFIHEVHRDRKHHHKKEAHHTIKFGSSGLIAEKSGHNGFHHRILTFENDRKDLWGLCANFEKSFDEVQQVLSYCPLLRKCDS